jgi:hypothetical protein
MLKRRIILILIVLAAVLISSAPKSSEDYMLTLPVYKRYMCALCHTSADPSPFDLNDFGKDYQSNDYIWDKRLAEMDSDDDDYPNGIELGDENGDGEPEIFVERSNPGDPLNNPSSIDKDTWGIIKNLFRD